MSVTKPAAGFWPTYPIDVRALARRRAHDADAVEQHVAVEDAAAEARHQAGDDAEQGGLADAGRAGDQHQLAVVEGEVDPVEDRRAVVVAEADAAQLDHAATSWRTRVSGAVAGRAGSGAQRAPSRPIPMAASATPLTGGNDERDG